MCKALPSQANVGSAFVFGYIEDQRKNGKLVFDKYNTFGKCYSVVSRKMTELAEVAGIEKRVIYYSARKSFVQHGFELGISLESIEILYRTKHEKESSYLQLCKNNEKTCRYSNKENP